MAAAHPRWFPHRTPLQVGTEEFSAAQIIAVVGPTLTAARRQRIEQIVAARVCSVAVLLEGVHDAGNVAAVLRTAEGLGFPAVHIVAPATGAQPQRPASPGRVRPSTRVTQGADKWLDVERWQRLQDCLAELRRRGFRVLATALSNESVPLSAVDLSTPVAFAFGNEHAGVSTELLRAADATVQIPMLGFTRSFNISVAAAMVLHHVRGRRQAASPTSAPPAGGDLDAAQRETLTALYYLRSQPHAAAHLGAGHGEAAAPGRQ